MKVSYKRLVTLIKSLSVGDYALCKMDFKDCSDRESGDNCVIAGMVFFKGPFELGGKSSMFAYLDLNFLAEKGFLEIYDALKDSDQEGPGEVVYRKEFNLEKNLQSCFDQPDFWVAEHCV